MVDSRREIIPTEKQGKGREWDSPIVLHHYGLARVGIVSNLDTGTC